MAMVWKGDSHPGNVLLLNDQRLGLVDYGQVGRLTERDRLLYCELVLALSEDRREDVVRIAKTMGARTQRNLPDVIYTLTAFWVKLQSTGFLKK